MEVAHQIHTRLRYLLCNCRAEILGSSGAQAGAGGYCGRDGARNDQSPSVSNDVQSYISLILQTRWHTQYTGHTHEDLVHLDTAILTFHLQPTNNPCKILSIHCYTVGPVPQRLYVSQKPNWDIFQSLIRRKAKWQTMYSSSPAATEPISGRKQKWTRKHVFGRDGDTRQIEL